MIVKTNKLMKNAKEEFPKNSLSFPNLHDKTLLKIVKILLISIYSPNFNTKMILLIKFCFFKKIC